MARKIKSTGVKMVLSGEGADEIFGGYLYFHKAPNAQEFHEETIRKVYLLFMFIQDYYITRSSKISDYHYLLFICSFVYPRLPLFVHLFICL